MSARGSGEKPSIVVLHSINFEESWTKQTYLDIERKFGEEGFTVKAIPLQIPGIRTMEGFQEKRTMILERVPVPPTLVVCIGDPSWLVARPLFDKEWKDIPSIICYARDYMYPKEEYLIDLDKNVLDTLVPITDVVKGYNATFIKYPVYIKQTIELIKKLQPELTKLAFIFDRRYISQQTKADVEAVLRKDFPGIQFEPLSTTSISTENLLDRLASFANKTGVLYYSWYRTRKDNENRYLVDNVQKMTNSFSVPPIFTLQDVQTENGNFAGGYYVSPEDYAQVTVNTIEMILSGKDSKEIPIQTAETPRAYLNYQHLLLHQIDPGLYPPNATYFQEPPGFLQKYKIHIISLLVILALLITIGILRVRLFIQKQKAKDKELQIARQAQDLNQKYQLVLKASNMMTWIWDVKEARLECNNIYLTQRSIRDKGTDGQFCMSADEFYSGIHPEDLEQMQDAINKLIAEKNGTRTEGQGEDRGIQPVEIRLPSEHEPRDTYPAERYRRLFQPASGNLPLRGDERVLRDHRDEQRASPSTRERYPGPIEDRGRANGFHLFRVQRIHAIPELIPDLPKPGERRCHSLLRDT